MKRIEIFCGTTDGRLTAPCTSLKVLSFLLNLPEFRCLTPSSFVFPYALVSTSKPFFDVSVAHGTKSWSKRGLLSTWVSFIHLGLSFVFLQSRQQLIFELWWVPIPFRVPYWVCFQKLCEACSAYNWLSRRSKMSERAILDAVILTLKKINQCPWKVREAHSRAQCWKSYTRLEFHLSAQKVYLIPWDLWGV